MRIFILGALWGCFCTCLGVVLVGMRSRWALWWRLGRLVLSGLVLGLSGAAWAQHGTYPDGSPWAEVPSPSGHASGPGQYQGASPPLPAISTRTMGDGRPGMYALSNCYEFVGMPPLSPPDYGGANLDVYLTNLWDGSHPTNNILYQQNEVARYDAASSAWKPGSPLGINYDTMMYSGKLPPGYYDSRASHQDSRGNGNLGSYRGWWCPKLVHIRVYVQLDGKAVKNFSVNPRAQCPAISTVPVPAWQRGVTDTSGYVDLLVPLGIRLVVVVDADSRYQYGTATGFWDVPTDQSLPDGFEEGPTGEIVKEFVLTLSPSASPVFGERSESNSSDNYSGFWHDLWVPDPEKLEQFQSHKDFWGSWGPFGLFNGFITLWGTAIFPDDETRFAGLVWQNTGVLGTSALDLRPLREGGPPYQDGGRGSLGGGVLGVVRGLVGLLVWASALFGVYKYLSPKWKA